MNEALAPQARRGRAATAPGLRLAAPDETLAGIYHPRAEAAVLLSQVMVRLHGIAVPVVQFVQASPGIFGAAVARSFAEAALPRLGRTLLVTVPALGTRLDAMKLPVAAGQNSGRRRTHKLACETLEIVPDACLGELYHARIGGEPNDSRANAGPSAAWLSGVKLDFRLLVIDCGTIDENPVALELGTLCHGSVLSVAAGESSFSEVQASVRQMRLAGGTVLGTVLYDAPPALSLGMWRWFGRRPNRNAG